MFDNRRESPSYYFSPTSFTEDDPLAFNQDVSVMYLGQVGHVAYELGVRADLSHRANPIKGLGLELRFNS